MTIETTANRISYTGSGTTGPFSFPYYFLADGDLTVIKTTIADGTEDTLTLTTDYTVSGAGEAAGGSVTLVATLSSSYKLTIIRDPDILQPADYPANDRFPAATHEEALDRATMIMQRLNDLIDRSFRLSDGNVSGISLILQNLGAGKLIAVNSAGTGIESIAAADVDLATVTPFIQTLLDDADAATARATLGAASLAANTFTGMQRFAKGSDIASAATTDLGTATGNTVDVTHSTGTTAITSLGGASLQAGTEIETRFVISGGTLTLTHHATNLYLAGRANITLANGDVIRWRKMHDSNAEWKMVGGVKANGAAWAGNPIYGQCILDKVSTNLVLSPCDGNLLTINGVAYEIPDAGVSLSAAAVSDGFKYIYAYMNSGTMTLEASTTARATSTTAGNKGVQIKSGDDSRTLVGAAYCQSNAWNDVNYSRCVLSWFNRRDITGRAWLTANRTVAAAGPQEIHAEARVYFICWADEAVHFHSNGTASNSNAYYSTDMCIGIDGVATIGGISRAVNTTAAALNSLSATTQAPAGQLSENALHYAVLAGGASAYTATYYGGADNASRCEINFRTRG